MIQCAKLQAGCITAARIGSLNAAALSASDAAYSASNAARSASDALLPPGLQPVRIVPTARALSLGEVGYALDTQQLVDRRSYKNVTPKKPDPFWEENFRRAYEQ